MTTLIIYSHPYEKSFNHAILEQVCTQLNKKGTSYEVIDLYKEQFDPRYTAQELALFSKGQTEDALVKKYQQQIQKCSEIIFITPIWWNDLPGMLKGFIDKVMKKTFSYVDTPKGVKGKLIHIKKATVITTSSSPTWYLRFFAGNAIQSVFLKATLKQIGIKKSTWKNLGSINKQHTDSKEKFLNELVKLI